MVPGNQLKINMSHQIFTNGNKGIAIAVPKKYEQTCLRNIQFIRRQGCSLPIELWEAGKEISQKTRRAFASVDQLSFRNIEEFSSNGKHWKGFQIKAFILAHSVFEEVIVCDADVSFHQRPELLFDDQAYLSTGTYFFRDLEHWNFSQLNNRWTQFRQHFYFNKFTSAAYFKSRKQWLVTLMPIKSPLFPTEWAYIYQQDIPKVPVKEALQESGVVAMNKKIQHDSVKFIYTLNEHHKETYKYVWGDKETFWIGCVMAGKSFFFNPAAGYISPETGLLSHNYKGKIFFSQKG